MFDEHEVDEEEHSHQVHIQYTEAERHKIVDAATSPMIAAAEQHAHTKALASAILAELDAAPYASRRAELQARLCAMAVTDNDAVVEAINAHALQLAEDAHEVRLRATAHSKDTEAGPLTREVSIAPPARSRPPRLRKDARDGWAYQEIAGPSSRRL